MKSDELLDAIGEAKDAYILDARKKYKVPRWTKWLSVTAACLVLVFGVNFARGFLGGNAGGGSGGNDDLSYMYYVGPVLPLTLQGDASGITATRNVDYNFSGYNNSYNKAFVTDSYVLENLTETEQTVTLLYPYVGNMRNWEYCPTLYVEGEAVSTTIHPGPYSGGFEGAWGSDEPGSVNLRNLDCFEGYQTLLATEDYLNSAFDPLPSLDQKVYVYKLHDYVYSSNSEAANPTLSFSFYTDFEKTTVFSYNMNGASWDHTSGYCSRHIGGIEYNPNVDPKFQHPHEGYIILLGEDLEGYTLQGYQDGGCDPGEELDDLSCSVTRYETTLGEILSTLWEDFMGYGFLEEEFLTSGQVVADGMSFDALYLGLAAELLSSYGLLGESSMERYDVGMLENIFSATLNDSRVIYLSFQVTIPPGALVRVKAELVKDASVDYVGKYKDRDGYDMATHSGSRLTFTEQTASICHFDGIEIVSQNFGFDPANGITQVILDLNQPHYWLQVRKIPSPE